MSSDELPETFDRFARDTCIECGDLVAVRYLDDGRCVGCRDDGVDPILGGEP